MSRAADLPQNVETGADFIEGSEKVIARFKSERSYPVLALDNHRALVLCLFGIGFVLLWWLKNDFEKKIYTVTDRRIVKQNTGSGKIESVDFREIESIKLRKSFTGRIFGYGTLMVYYGDEKLYVEQVPKPENVKKFLNNQTPTSN